MRHLVKLILKKLAKIAIKKHDIKFIVITGWFNTELAKETTYDILSSKYNVRRNTRKIIWDFYVPLLILGHSRERLSTLKLIEVLFKSLYGLTFFPKNPHYLVLDFNLAHETIAKYWGDIVCPEILVVQNTKRSNVKIVDMLIENTKENNGTVFVDAGVEAKKV